MSSTPEIELLPEPAGSDRCLECAMETSAWASTDTAYQEMFDSPHNDVPSSRSSVTWSAHGDALASKLHHRLNQTTALLQTLGVTDHRGRRVKLTGNDARKRDDWWTDVEPADVLRCAGRQRRALSVACVRVSVRPSSRSFGTVVMYVCKTAIRVLFTASTGFASYTVQGSIFVTRWRRWGV